MLRYLGGTMLGYSPFRALLALLLSLTTACLHAQSVEPAQGDVSATTINSGLQGREFTTVPPARDGQVNLGTLDLYRFGEVAANSSSAAQSSADYARRKAKAVLAIQQVFGSPAVLAVQEVKDLATLNDLASAASRADTPYRAYLEGTDTDNLNLGFLVSSTAADVLRVEEMQKTDTYLQPDGAGLHPVWQHPPLVLHLSLRGKGSTLATPLTLINVLLSPQDDLCDSQAGRTPQMQRQHQAVSLATLIQNYESAGEQVVVLGNFNTPAGTYENPDVLSTIMGVLNADGSTALASARGPVLTDETATIPAEQRYNAFAQDQPVALERILVSSGLSATVQQPHFTAGSDSALAEIDGTPIGLGPHDGQLITLALATPARLDTKSNAFTGGFGNQVIGTTSAPQTITLTALDIPNARPVIFQTPTITGANASDFAIVSNTCISLAPSVSCTITLTFTPSAIGTRSATLNAPNDSIDHPDYSLPLSGIGVTPLQASPTSLNFGNIDVTARSAPQTISVTNLSARTVALGRISANGDFLASSTCGAALAPKTSCTATVIFTPTATGVRNGTLMFGNSSLGGSVPLTGNGVDFSIAVTPTSGSTIAGKSVFPGANLTPTPGFSNTISLTCTTDAAASFCQPGQTGAPLTAAAQIPLQIDTTAKYIIVGFGGAAATRGLALLAFGTSMLLVCTRLRIRHHRGGPHLLALAFLFSLTVMLAGCGSRQPPQNTPYTAPGTYTYTVTATDGILSHTAAYSLQVKAF